MCIQADAIERVFVMAHGKIKPKRLGGETERKDAGVGTKLGTVESSTQKRSPARSKNVCKPAQILEIWCREGASNPQGTKYRRILSSTVGSEQLRKFSTLSDSSTAYQHIDSRRHDPICSVLNMELLQFYYSDRLLLHSSLSSLAFRMKVTVMVTVWLTRHGPWRNLPDARSETVNLNGYPPGYFPAEAG
jgi:hypothetical protein